MAIVETFATLTLASFGEGQLTECLSCLRSATQQRCKRLPPCTHTFCLSCLYKGCTADGETGDGAEAKCPLCRQSFVVPDGRLDMLPDVLVALQHQDCEDSDGVFHRPVLRQCPVCRHYSDDTNVADNETVHKGCVKCNENMCEMCEIDHKKSHQLFSIDDKQRSVCSEHRTVCEDEGPAVETYCEECKQSNYPMCKSLRLEGYYCSELKQIRERFKEEMIEIRPLFTQRIAVIRQDLEHTNEMKEEFLLKMSKITEEISDAHDALNPGTRFHLDELVERCRTFKDARLKEMKARTAQEESHLVMLQSFDNFTADLLENGSALDVLRAADDWRRRAEELLNFKNDFQIVRLLMDQITFTRSHGLDGQTQQRIGNLSFYDFQYLLHHATVDHVITIEKTQIHGLATLGPRLYTVCRGSREVIVYDSADLTAVTDRLPVRHMTDPNYLIACSLSSCLYISDWSGSVLRVELSDRSVTAWSVTGRPSCLFLTSVHNVLVTLYVGQKVQEFTPRGELLREFNLDSSIVRFSRFAELSTGQFVVCHGQGGDNPDPIHRVCIVDTEGRIVRSYGGAWGSDAGQLNGPYCVIVDSTDHVLVADCINNKIRLFSPTLTHLGDVTLSGYQLGRPHRLHFDELTGRLYIGESDLGSGRLFVVSLPCVK